MTLSVPLWPALPAIVPWNAVVLGDGVVGVELDESLPQPERSVPTTTVNNKGTFISLNPPALAPYCCFDAIIAEL